MKLLEIRADDVRLDRLLQLYMHEWSDRVASVMGEDARYTYEDLPDYLEPETHVAYLFVEEDGKRPFGFALARRDEGGTWHVEEMFVIAGARRRGAGATCARLLFATRPGRWTLTVRPENAEALVFWRRVAPGADERVELGDDGIARTRLSFVR